MFRMWYFNVFSVMKIAEQISLALFDSASMTATRRSCRVRSIPSKYAVNAIRRRSSRLQLIRSLLNAVM